MNIDNAVRLLQGELAEFVIGLRRRHPSLAPLEAARLVEVYGVGLATAARALLGDKTASSLIRHAAEHAAAIAPSWIDNVITSPSPASSLGDQADGTEPEEEGEDDGDVRGGLMM